MSKAVSGRRTLLQQGLALLGGGVAVAAGARWSRGAPAQASAAGAAPTTFYARVRPVPATSRGLATSDARLIASGELFDAPEGRRIGAFSANSAGNSETQILQLPDGTLFGMAVPGAAANEPRVHAIVGGTAKYAGARGSYVQRAVDGAGRGHELIEFTVTFAG